MPLVAPYEDGSPHYCGIALTSGHKCWRGASDSSAQAPQLLQMSTSQIIEAFSLVLQAAATAILKLLLLIFLSEALPLSLDEAAW